MPLEVQFGWADADIALKNWRRAFFEVGVYVFKDQFRAEGFSGFCLYHEEFPIIYVNNTTTKTRQIFTLFHELAHLLFHTSGVDTPNDDYIEALPRNDRQIEIISNRLAARLLVPEDAFVRALAGRPPTEATASEIARQFSVSRESIYRKFLDRDLITRADYDAAVNRWNQQKKGPPGGDPYNTKIAYLGDEYITRAFQSYYQNQIDADQLADYLDTKPRNIFRTRRVYISESQLSYVFDTNAFSQLFHSYYRDQFPTLWRRFRRPNRRWFHYLDTRGRPRDRGRPRGRPA